MFYCSCTISYASSDYNSLPDDDIGRCQNVVKMNLVAFVFLINFITRSRLIYYALSTKIYSTYKYPFALIFTGALLIFIIVS